MSKEKTMKKTVPIGLCVLLGLLASISFAAEVNLFGPKQYDRTKGAPDIYTDNFAGLFTEIVEVGKITILNGNQTGKNKIEVTISSAEILVNGEIIFGPSDFKRNVHFLEAPISLGESNSLSVELRSKPDSYLTIQITQDIDPPTVSINANPDAIKVNEDSTLEWSSALADTCSIEPDIGSVDVNGSITVSPDVTTTYTITASGPGGVSTAFITITHLNTAPAVVSQSATTDEDIESLIFLMASDLDNDLLVYQIVTSPVHGTLTGEAPSLTYKPDDNYHGSDSFTFKAHDGLEDSNVGTVSLTIHPVNDLPLAMDDTATTDEDTPLTTGKVLANDTDVDGDILSMVGFTQASNGTVVDNGNGTFTYSPNLNFNGTDSFTYIAGDGNGGTDTGTVTMTVNPINDPPMADAGPDQGVFRNDPVLLDGSGSSDVDGDTLSCQWSFLSTPDGSTATFSDPSLADPFFVPDISGAYVVELTVNDGIVDSTSDMVMITASPIIVQVPEVAGMARTNAEAAILAAGLTVGSVTEEHSDTVPAGDVISQAPVAGSSTEEYSPIDLILSLGSAFPTVSISADPMEITAGELSTLVWDSTNADSCMIEPGIGNVAVSGSASVSPTETITYTITATGPSGTDTASVTISVIHTTTYVSISATPATIQEGEIATLSWTSSNAQSVFIDNGVGVVLLNGSTTVSPENSTTYTISVTGPTGSSSAQARVMVLGIPEPQPEGSFGEQYEDLIPPDATLDQYDSKRFSLITGLVQAIDSSPVQNVSVTIFDNPQYGTVFTDASGQFSIPVEGKGTMTVVYQKTGFISAQRKVYVPRNDIAITETIQMIPEDPASTIVTFDGNPDTVMTHQSTPVSDEFGARSATLVFAGDNQAYLVDEDGNAIHELSTITTRATEFITPESMPAILPPNSAYTYCVELSADGAQSVRFDKPVIMWVDNFLGFDVGEIVPVGYYDRDKGVWVPSDNGVVVRLLDEDADGIVDAMDVDGDDLPDDLDNDGSFGNEVTGLDDPARYTPFSTFWRIAVTHFTPFDCNWPYSPPLDATSPNPEEVPEVDQQKEDCPSPGCVVEARSRIIHEDIPMPGTDMTLHYASHRVEGYKTAITVPASGETVPNSLKYIIVKLEIAGRILEQSLNPLPNQRAEFVWDGLDHLGDHVTVPIAAHVSVGFVYNAIYLSPAIFAQAFGQAGGKWTDILARQEVVFWKRNSITCYPPKAKGKALIADGWTISSNHHLNPVDPSELYKGDGTTSRNNARIIDTVAGTGSSGYTGDGGPATFAQLYNPSGITVDTNSSIYIADTYNHCVRKMDADGIITTVAGTGSYGYSGDGGPATLAQLYRPYGIAVDTDSNLYIADTHNHRVRKVDADGIITTVAGTGSCGADDYNGHGGPATLADLGFPYDVAVDTQGNLYIDDRNSHSIRKVDQNGIISTVVDRESAQCYLPKSVAVDGEGNIYIADTNHHYIKKVDQSGTTTTIAGNGIKGYGGDGGPATLASLNFPRYIALDTDGKLYICDYSNHRIRQVDTEGFITTLAGIGSSGYTGDGGPATSAELSYPSTVDVDTDGNLYIADSSNHCIRKVVVPSDFATLTFAGEILFAEENGLGHIMTSGAGRHLKTIDLATGVALIEFGYDVDNKLVSITDQFGNQTTIQRDADGDPTTIISPDGITTTLTIDANNHLTEITYPDGSHYDFEYTQDGLMTAKIEPEGNRFEHVFNSNGRLSDATDEEGGQWNYTRTADEYGDILAEVLTGQGNLTSYLDHTYSTGAYVSSITDPTGTQTLFSQSDDGLTVNKSLPCGMDLEFKYGVDSEYKYKVVKEITERTPSALEMLMLHDKIYDDTNSDDIPDLITETVTVNGKVTTLINNVLQAQKTITSPEGRPVTTFYDPLTLLTESLSIPGLFDTTYEYDARGRLTSIATNTRETSFTYNSNGFLESVTDPEDFATSYTYDRVGRMTWIDRPDGTSIGFDYDGNGNMTVLTDPSNVDHGFGFNLVNRNSSYQTPLSGSYTYSYDKDRRLIRTTFPSGAHINNIYNTTQLIQIQTPEGNIDFTYLCGTKVDSVTNGADTITYEYDGKLVTSEILSGNLNQSLEYTYNNDFNVVSFSYAGDSISYTYDNDGLLTGSGAFTITRDPGNGLPETVTDGTLNLGRTFNGYGEVESQDFSVSGHDLTSWSLTRDENGRITHKTETLGGVTSNYVYAYDSMGRLTTVTKDGGLVEEYEYSLNGTRTYEMNALRGIPARTLTYSDEDHLLTAGTSTYEYDLDGFLATKTDATNMTTYDYSSRGELMTVTLPDGTAIEYVHDPLGRRIAKKVNGVIVEKYLWKGLTQLLAVYDGSDNLLMRFEYADGRMPVSMMRSDGTYYFTYDQVGSLRVVADSTGTSVKAIDYDSFGNIINDTGPSFEVPFGFAGGLHDRDTGLVRFCYRDYDPDIGRWTAKDPILFAGGDMDLYGYCLNDTVNLVDSLGSEFYGVANAGFLGFDYSTSTQNPSQGTLTTGSGVIVGGSLSVGYDFGKGVFGDILHRLLAQHSINIGLGKYLGITVAPDLSKIQFNIGMGLALPVSYDVPVVDANWEPIDATFGDDLYDLFHDDPCK
jgi:RHS repeat-associated protein